MFSRIPTTVVSAIILCGLCSTVLAQAAIIGAQDAVAKIEALGGRIYRMPDGQVDIVDMKGPQVTDAHLVLLQSIPSVRVLGLDSSRVTDAGLEQLLNLPNLEEVSLRRTQVTPRAAARFKAMHPKVSSVRFEQNGLRLERLVVLVILVPLALFGVWLIRLTHQKQPELSPKLYVRGIVVGIFLMLTSLILTIVAVLQTLGFDVHLSNLFD